jgi:hypothetical protein
MVIRQPFSSPNDHRRAFLSLESSENQGKAAVYILFGIINI